MKEYPGVSVVITTYNEEQQLKLCLDSLKKQDYPQEKIEIVLVDDKSTDNTVKIAKKYTDKIYYSGKRFCEISRAAGIKNTNNELILFMDADNILPNSGFLSNAVVAIMSEPDIVGSYPWRFHYNPKDPPSNRYCSLFGLNEPFQYYTRAKEHVSYMSNWDILGTPADHGNYLTVEFPQGSNLTLGAIGFLTKKSLVEDKIYNEFFFHSDVFNELIHEGKNKFVLIKQEIIHNHCRSSKVFFRKLARNFDNLLKYPNNRKSIWATKNKKLFVMSTIKMVSVIIPIKDAIRGFIKKPDLAWFLHPFYCFGVVAMYSYKTLHNKLTNLL